MYMYSACIINVNWLYEERVYVHENICCSQVLERLFQKTEIDSFYPIGFYCEGNNCNNNLTHNVTCV